jgi:hypothetical protein
VTDSPCPRGPERLELHAMASSSLASSTSRATARRCTSGPASALRSPGVRITTPGGAFAIEMAADVAVAERSPSLATTRRTTPLPLGTRQRGTRRFVAGDCGLARDERERRQRLVNQAALREPDVAKHEVGHGDGRYQGTSQERDDGEAVVQSELGDPSGDSEVVHPGFGRGEVVEAA